MKIIKNNLNHFKKLFTEPGFYFVISQKSLIYNLLFFLFFSLLITIANYVFWNHKYLSKYLNQIQTEIITQVKHFPSDLVFDINNYHLSIRKQDQKIDNASLSLDNFDNQTTLFYKKEITTSADNFFQNHPQATLLSTSNYMYFNFSAIHTKASDEIVIQLPYQQLPFLREKPNLTIDKQLIENNQENISNYLDQDLKIITQATTFLTFLSFQFVALLYEVPLILMIFIFFRITREKISLKQLIAIFLNINVVTSVLAFIMRIIYQNSSINIFGASSNIIIFTYLWFYYWINQPQLTSIKKSDD